MDRSISIRQAVADVEETLLIAVGLVILVIFLFLRSASATFIPALAVPISLFGTCAVMYVLDYSINNMTLLALTLRSASWSTTPSSCWKTSSATSSTACGRSRPR